MIIRYFSSDEIDLKKWNYAIDHCVNGNIYAYSWYLDAVSVQWGALIAGDYEAVMPLVFNHKYCVSYIYPPNFCQQLGLFYRNPDHAALCNEFLNKIPEKYKFVEMRLNIGNLMIDDSFSPVPRPNLVLDLKGDSFTRYSDNHRRNIRKCADAGVVFSIGNDVDKVVSIFRENRGSAITSLKEKDYVRFKNVYSQAYLRKAASIIMASNPSGDVCAGAVFFESHGRAYFIFSGLTQAGRDVSAMHGLVDFFIKSNEKRLHELDFEGSADEGVARFYRGFGSREFVYLQIKKNRLPAPWKWFKR